MQRKRKKNAFGLTRFNRAPESMLEQAYLTLSDPTMDRRERLRLALVVSYLRGTYDLLRFTEVESECRQAALEAIHGIIQDDALSEDQRKEKIAYWIKQAKNWRKSKEFSIMTQDIAEFGDDWTEKIGGLTPSQKYSSLGK